MEDVRHNCGWVVTHTLHDTYNFLRSLQHRGRDAAGIAAIGNNRIDVKKWEGPVSRVDITSLHNIFPSSRYHTFMGHVRYATKGRKEKLLSDAHPYVIGGKASIDNGDIVIHDCEAALVHNGQVSGEHFTGLDQKLLKSDCDTESILHFYHSRGEKELLRSLPGAYALAIADKHRNETMIMRDHTGLRPGVLGLKDGKYCAASEDIALTSNGGEFVEYLSPGKVYYLDASGTYRNETIVQPRLQRCFFEWNYIARADSILDHVSVRSLRHLLGEALASEFHPADADAVTYLPRCPIFAARSYAEKTGIPFKDVFYKKRGERSFQGPTPDERKNSIENNLYLLPESGESLRGKTVIVIDDSTIRGTNSKRAKDLLDSIGVKKMYLANYTPPIGIIGQDGQARGCLFGVDMPPSDTTFVARGRSTAEISAHLGMETIYLSVKGMTNAFERLGLPGNSLCTYCIGGEHPFKV